MQLVGLNDFYHYRPEREIERENPITYNSCWYIVGVFGLYLVYRLYLVIGCIEFTSVR